ncbi:hypothetical protein HY310_01630, partial [Candidatus Microgenomates bacterium]|nr:hypothetical protein [Candidatus Microgenomates bacterium]
MNIDASFKLFDIRGEYPIQVDEKMAFAVGKALFLLRRPQKVLIAMDNRASSPSLKSYLIDALTSNGIIVDDLGKAPSPEFYFSVVTQGYDLGVMITASHIGESENGFKFVNRNGLPFDQGEILDLKYTVSKFKDIPIVIPHGEACEVSFRDLYLKKIESLIPKIDFKLKVVLDLTGSTVENTALPIFDLLKINYSVIKNAKPGSPLILENQKALSEAVINSKADLGIKWDSDGDRVVFMDCRGKMIPLSYLLGILGSKNGKKVAIDVRSGLVVRDIVEESGGEIVVLPAWSQFIKFAMQSDPEITFGGETSGHFIFKDFYCLDDGLVAALRFLVECESGYVLEKIDKLSKKYYELPEKNFPCNLTQAPVILKSLSDFYRGKLYTVSVEDGLTVFGPD